jgi:hypothetical protein
LHELSASCVNLFSRAVIQVAIECWSWIISSRPDIEPLVLEEMLNSWQASVDLRLGMFSDTTAETNPLAKAEKDVLRPRPPEELGAHRIWLKYLQERLDIAKYKSELELELFFNLMHNTLSFASNNDSTLNRHVTCVGLRFRFLVMALSFVQSSSGNFLLLPNNTISKWILRERIYYTALDYFTAPVRAPTQASSELREDIQYLLEFWNKIVAEKKYLKEDNILLTGSTSTMAPPTPMANQSDAVSLTGVNDNSSGTNTVNPALGTSVTYNSVSGLPGNMEPPAPMASAPVLTTNSTIGQLVASSNVFLEPTLMTTGSTNAATGTLTPATSLPRNESSLNAPLNANPSVWMNTLSKRSAPIHTPQHGMTTGAATTLTSRIDLIQLQQLQVRFFKDFSKKRALLLYLISHELDHLYTFYNPFNLASLTFDRIDTAINHLKVTKYLNS